MVNKCFTGSQNTKTTSPPTANNGFFKDMMPSYMTNGDTFSGLPPTKSLSRHAKHQNAHADSSYQRGGGHSRGQDDSYKFRDNRLIIK